jgi:hypothetical protein
MKEINAVRTKNIFCDDNKNKILISENNSHDCIEVNITRKLKMYRLRDGILPSWAFFTASLMPADLPT